MNPNPRLASLLAESRMLNARVAERRAELIERERQLEFELSQVREALAALPTPSESSMHEVHFDEAVLVRRVTARFAARDAEGSPDNDASVSAHILAILRDSSVSLSAGDIAEQIVRSGHPVPIGSVHTALSRLHSRGVIYAHGERGDRRYVVLDGRKCERDVDSESAMSLRFLDGRREVLTRQSDNSPPSRRRDR